MRSATATGRRALCNGASIGVGEEQGDHAGSMLPLAVKAGNGGIGVLDGAQGIKTDSTILAIVLV